MAVKDENYVNIQGWMSKSLGLKGNSLLVYAIIYGFCQDGESCYHGSLEYLQEWTNSTRQGIINVLKQLVQDGFIIKENSTPNNKYYVKKVYEQSKESLHQDDSSRKENLHNNKDILNIDKNIDKYSKEKELQEKVDSIINYLNKVCNTKFRSSSSATKRLIKARLNEGAQLQDFYDVVDFKWKEWGVKPVTFSGGQSSITYLRPSTLFGNKMEEYVQQAWLAQSSEGPVVKSVEKLEERSDLVF